MKRQVNGFTLIELMIVVAIIAIISAFAYPAYQDSTRRANRADGLDTLLDTAQRLERCYASFGSYNNAGCSIANGATITSTRGYYDIAVTTAASTYSLTATPVAGQVQESDGKCASFTITNTGQKTATGTDSAHCW